MATEGKPAMARDRPNVPADSVVSSPNPYTGQRSRFENVAEGLLSYLGGWWTHHGKLIQGLIGDLILYLCLLGYLALISGLIQRFGLGPDFHELQRYAILIADGVILLMFIRKLAITLRNL